MATASELIPSGGAMVPVPHVVRERVQETADTWTLTFEPLAGEPSSVAPGQFVMVYVFGVGEVPISVSGALDRPTPLVLTVRSVGAVTSALRVRAGRRARRARAVRDRLAGSGRGRRRRYLAGGIGLAPLRPVLLQAFERRAAYDEVVLLYGARTPRDLLYVDELERWREKATVDVTVDAAASDWRGRVGVVPQLVPGARFDPDAATAFVCGPEIMMRYGVQALLERGVATERIHVSLERNMRCGVGHCGHCQLGPTLICRDGPVYDHATAAPWLEVREL